LIVYTLIIPGEVPSLKNSKKIVLTKNGKRRVVSSDFYQRWAKASLWLLKAEYEAIDREWNYPVIVDFKFYRATRRKFDYINMGQGPLDLMVKAGILNDDDMEHVVPGQWSWEVDKQNPRVKITIREKNNA